MTTWSSPTRRGLSYDSWRRIAKVWLEERARAPAVRLVGVVVEVVEVRRGVRARVGAGWKTSFSWSEESVLDSKKAVTAATPDDEDTPREEDAVEDEAMIE